MPVAALPVVQLTSRLVPGSRSYPGFDNISLHFDTTSEVHLRSSPQHTPDHSRWPFPRSLTTIALYNSRIGRFDSSFWSPKPRDLLSSLIQHEYLTTFFLAHKRSVLATTIFNNIRIFFSLCLTLRHKSAYNPALN